MNARHSGEPLDRADDFVMLARELNRKRNFPMAALALTKADSALELYMNTTPLSHHPPIVQKMKEQIATMVKELKSGAA
jgi:hypothetical protein